MRRRMTAMIDKIVMPTLPPIITAKKSNGALKSNRITRTATKALSIYHGYIAMRIAVAVPTIASHEMPRMQARLRSPLHQYQSTIATIPIAWSCLMKKLIAKIADCRRRHAANERDDAAEFERERRHIDPIFETPSKHDRRKHEGERRECRCRNAGAVLTREKKNQSADGERRYDRDNPAGLERR